MFSDPVRMAEAINNPKFHAGEQVTLSGGPHKYLSGTFVALKEDAEWAAIEEPNGMITSHPVEWMSKSSGKLGS